MQARNSICLHARGLAELITPGSQFTINVKTGKIITPGQVNGSGGGRLDIITVTRPLYTETLDYQVPA